MPLTVLNNTKMLTGEYTGDGNDDRNINISVNLAAKNHVYVHVKETGTSKAVFKTDKLNPNQALPYDANGVLADRIQDFTSTGFEIGTTAQVNTNGNGYRYIVWYQD